MTSLFDPIKIGDMECPNRIFMAPLTRGRANTARIPQPIMAKYYAQRAEAGLIISEATAISARGYGWKYAPGIYTRRMEQGWKEITDAVHDAGGRIYCQLWHMGRVTLPAFLRGRKPLAPSAVKARGKNISLTPPMSYITPKPMSQRDIENTIKEYAKAATRALRAGFDGVEIHGANGYLIDQFLRDSSNEREDDYGGNVENRCRFMKEVVTAVTEAVGSSKTAIRLSPENRKDFNSMKDSDPEETFLHAAEILNEFDLAYLHIKETSRVVEEEEEKARGRRKKKKKKKLNREKGEYRMPPYTAKMRKVYDGVIVGNEQHTKETGQKMLDEGLADAISYGVPFLANPDLVTRYKEDAELNKANPETFYTRGPEGYIDYPTLKELEEKRRKEAEEDEAA